MKQIKIKLSAFPLEIVPFMLGITIVCLFIVNYLYTL
jgi:hypothetical protein